MILVRRLKNTSGGNPYAIDKAECKTAEEASKIAAVWWESGGTLSVVVEVDGREDCRYTKMHADTGRYPEDWGMPEGYRPPRTDTGAVSIVRPAAKAPPTPRSTLPPPTLFNEPQKAPRANAGGCPCCYQPRCPERDPEDPGTPSGRIAELRCPECGVRIGGSDPGAIQKLYLTYQARLSTDHQQKAGKPWNPNR